MTKLWYYCTYSFRRNWDMRKVFVSVLVLSAFVANMDCYGARKRKSSKNARTASIRERSVKRMVSSTASSYSLATSSYSSSLLENLSRFQSSVFGEKLMYGKSYALQDMFTIATHSYYYKNGSQAELKEQFCFGPYMKLTGVGASSSATSSVVEANGSLQCVDLEKDTIYSLSLLDATDGQIENALHTSSVSGVVSGDQRVAYVSRSGNPIATQYFNSEKYIDVSEYAKKINEAVAMAKSSCGSFKSDMDKLKSQLGFGVALSSGIGVALSGASTGVGIYNIKKTNEVQSTIKKQENMQKNLEEIARSSDTGYQEVKDKNSGKFDVSQKAEKEIIADKRTYKTKNEISKITDLRSLNATLVNKESCEHIESFKEYCDKLNNKCKDLPSSENVNDYLKGMQAYSGGDEYYEGCFSGSDENLTFVDSIYYELKDGEKTDKECTGSDKSKCTEEPKKNCVELKNDFNAFENLTFVDSIYYELKDGEKTDKECTGSDKSKCTEEPKKNCVELKNDFNALSEDAKRRWIFQKDYNTYSDLKKQCDVANGKVDTVNKSSEQYKKYVDSVDSSMKTSRNLDIVQAGLSGASTIASGVSLGFSVSAIGTVGDAIDELSKCNAAISKLRNVYGEYKAELEADEEE